MGKLKYRLIDFIKTSSATKALYVQLKKHIGVQPFSFDLLPRIIPVMSEDAELRYNLVLPTLRKTKVFGGILTTIKILQMLMRKKGSRGRIIIINEEDNSPKWTYAVPGFSAEKTAKNEIVFLSESKELVVERNDVFILSNWRTAYAFFPVLNWQIHNYGLRNRKALYLIQDYEPGFFPWSSEYVLAEATYKTNAENIIALYNSKELHDYFKQNGYSFSSDTYFEPIINEKLRIELLAAHDIPRRKQILIYGRPSESRNAFSIVREALDIWSRDYKNNVSEWRIISLGEQYKDIKLCNNTIEVLGKVTLEEYAQIMLSSYVGVSLMISPHPSYPPLEMSTFGIKTITNTFANKDLKYFNQNIISLANCTPTVIAEKLSEICDGFGVIESVCFKDNDYVRGGRFETVIYQVGDTIDEMVDKS